MFCGACGGSRSWCSANSDRCLVKTCTPSEAVKKPSSHPEGSVPVVGMRWITRHVEPSYVAGTRPGSVERRTTSIGCANSCTWTPERAQCALTSSASGPGPKPLVSPLGAGAGEMRTTSQSLPDVDDAPGGTVADPKPSPVFTVVAAVELVFFSTAPVEPTVKCTRNGRCFPLASWSSPASVCGPAASALVL